MAQVKTARRPVTAEDLYAFHIITGAELSPDGTRVVYAVQRVDQKTEKKYANLWMAATDGSYDRQFTQGDQTDASAHWSPDGKTLAFLSSRKEGQDAQLYLIDVDGGEARQLTDLKGTIANFTWSPDGTTILLEFVRKDQEAVDREADEQKKKLGVVSRHYTRLFYRGDGQGWLPHERVHLWTVNVATGATKQLTSGAMDDEYDASWSPDGKTILFCSNRRPDPDLEPDITDLFTIPATGGTMKLIKTPANSKEFARFSPDGTMISYVGPRDPNEWWQNMELWVVPADGGSAARSLTASRDISLTASTINDMGEAPQSAPLWSADGKVLYFQISEHGSTKLMAITVDGASLYSLIDENGCVGPFSLDRNQKKVAYFFGTMDDPGQIWIRDMETGAVRQLTHVNADLFAHLQLSSVREVWFTARDGYKLQGWIMTPPGFDPKKKYPSILEIHGGPQAQYGNLFMHEFEYLAAGGYVVFFTNPAVERGTAKSMSMPSGVGGGPLISTT